MTIVLNIPKKDIVSELYKKLSSLQSVRKVLVNEYSLAGVLSDVHEDGVAIQFKSAQTDIFGTYDMFEVRESEMRFNKFSSLRKQIKKKMSNDEIDNELKKIRDEWQRDI